jgi:hypothetical protein
MMQQGPAGEALAGISRRGGMHTQTGNHSRAGNA